MMAPSVAHRLRDMAGKLRADNEEGAFAPCDVHVQEDVGSLPAALERLADELDGRRAAA